MIPRRFPFIKPMLPTRSSLERDIQALRAALLAIQIIAFLLGMIFAIALIVS